MSALALMRPRPSRENASSACIPLGRRSDNDRWGQEKLAVCVLQRRLHCRLGHGEACLFENGHNDGHLRKVFC